MSTAESALPETSPTPITIPWKNSTILAPLTKGGNLPFRRLCADFGASITFSEMAYARFLNKSEGRELALIRKHASEQFFGVQLATNSAAEGIAAGKLAADRGATFIDLNCGCPIHDTTRRGLGASLLRNPDKLARLVGDLAQGLPIPLTVKIRLGWSDSEITVHEISTALAKLGIAALTIHGRTREQRYSRAADWNIVKEIGSQLSIPVIGNGDILTHYEAMTRRSNSNVGAIMVGRGALIKPWIFQEIKEGRELCLTPEQRVEVYLRLTQYFKEHFRTDEKGKKRTMFFLPWHFSFFHRYEPLPEAQFGASALEHPLIQSRVASITPEMGDLDAVLHSAAPAVHTRIAEMLWDAESVDAAAQKIASLRPQLDALSQAAQEGELESNG